MKISNLLGACDTCNAEQTLQQIDGIYMLTIHHDNNCPTLAAKEEKKR